MRSSLAVLLCTLPLQDNRTNSRASYSFVSVAIGAELELQKRLDRSGDKKTGVVYTKYDVLVTGTIMVKII